MGLQALSLKTPESIHLKMMILRPATCIAIALLVQATMADWTCISCGTLNRGPLTRMSRCNKTDPFKACDYVGFTGLQAGKKMYEAQLSAHEQTKQKEIQQLQTRYLDGNVDRRRLTERIEGD